MTKNVRAVDNSVTVTPRADTMGSCPALGWEKWGNFMLNRDARNFGSRHISIRHIGIRHIDIRLVIGLVLVVASIAGVYGLVAAADRTTAVYAASRPLAAGYQIQMRDLDVVHVRLAGASATYVSEDGLSRGAVLLRPIGTGELIPVAAIGSAKDITSTTVVLALTSALPVDTQPGSIVDLWAAPQLGQNNFGPPTILVPRAQVARVIENSGIGSSSRATNVEITIPRATVALVLQAQANGDMISLVPTAGALSGAGS